MKQAGPVRETPPWAPSQRLRVLAPWSATALAIAPDGSRLRAGRFNQHGMCDPATGEWTMYDSPWVLGIRYAPNGSCSVIQYYYGGLDCSMEAGGGWSRPNGSVPTRARLEVTNDRVLLVHDDRVVYHHLVDGQVERERSHAPSGFRVAAIDPHGDLVPIQGLRAEGYRLAAFAKDGTLVHAAEGGIRVVAPDTAGNGPHTDFPSGAALGKPIGLQVGGGRAVVWARGGLSIYDLTQGFLGALRGSGDVAAACVRGDRAYVAIGARVEEWSLALPVEAPPPRCTRPLGVAVTPDGRVVSVSRSERDIQVWSVDPVRLSASLPLPFEPRAWALCSDGDTVAFGADGPVELYSLASGQHLGSLQQDETIDSIHPTADNCVIVISSTRQQVRLWDVAARAQRLRTTSLQMACDSDYPAVHGTRVAMASQSGGIAVWQLEQTFPLQAWLGGPAAPRLKKSPARRTTVLRDDGEVAVVLSPKKMHVIDLATRALTWEVAVPEHARVLLAGGDFIVVGAPDEAKIWHVPTKKGKALKLGGRPRACLALRDGRAALSVEDRSLRIVELASGEVLGADTTEAVVAELAICSERLVGITDDGEVIAFGG